MSLTRRALPFLAPLISGCTPARLANALTPSGGYRLEAGLTYQPGPRGGLDVYEPAGASPATPLLVFFYGGGWRSGDREAYRFVAQALTTLGCAVAVPDYRLMPEGPWPAFMEDGAAAVRWLRQGPAAGRPMVLMGHSAGAFIALGLATDPRWLGDAARSRLAAAIGLAGPYDFQPEAPEYLATFARAPGRHARATPLDAGELAGSPPTLLMHGLADDLVSPGQSRVLAARLQSAGCPVREIEYAGLGHIGLVAALAAPLRQLGLAGAPVLADIGAFLRDYGLREPARPA
ncbi:alpha/beta hydrolase [Roseomonas sp. M0104]|uniref:Alpha/beta hydrolase n=1 Tax=Teichococcus coralli TaxID=2545983 RepID=A0A845B4U2_9PROT|nr:alpha/beta hydrolase [Pseudoroseomonas coralli]MXP62211.1 alpha/beta hydrolase [Pseudoroseomonas coralli]